MAGEESVQRGGFETLFRGNFPHILEQIFFSLDCDSFKNCRLVCKEWNRLFKSKSFEKFEHSNFGAFREWWSKEVYPKLNEIEKRTKENYLLECSIQGNGVEIRRLLSAGVSPNCRRVVNGKSPLHYAAQFGYTDMVKLLLDAGADPNMSDSWGLTPLHWASEPSTEDVDQATAMSVVKLLLNSGADPNKADKQGRTPLHSAAQVKVFHYKNRKIVQLLLGQDHPKDRDRLIDLGDQDQRSRSGARADPNRADNDGKVPMHYAAQYGQKNLIIPLLNAGAELCVADADGMTPLHWAVKENWRGFVTNLIHAGADLNRADGWGRNPLDWAASSRDHREVVQELVDAGAEPNEVDYD